MNEAVIRWLQLSDTERVARVRAYEERKRQACIDEIANIKKTIEQLGFRWPGSYPHRGSLHDCEHALHCAQAELAEVYRIIEHIMLAEKGTLAIADDSAGQLSPC